MTTKLTTCLQELEEARNSVQNVLGELLAEMANVEHTAVFRITADIFGYAPKHISIDADDMSAQFNVEVYIGELTKVVRQTKTNLWKERLAETELAWSKLYSLILTVDPALPHHEKS